MFYIFKKKQASSHLKKLYDIYRDEIHSLHCLDGKDAISTLKGVEQINCGD